MNNAITYAITLGETTTLRATREEMLAHLKNTYGVRAVKLGFTTWRLFAGETPVGRVDEV